MPWTIIPNCHAKVWTAGPIGVIPAGPAAFDGPAQLMTPARPGFTQAQTWGPRLVISPLGLPFDVAAFLGDQVTTQAYVQIVDDTLGSTLGWYQVVDLSPSTRPALVGGNYELDALFLLLQSVSSF